MILWQSAVIGLNSCDSFDSLLKRQHGLLLIKCSLESHITVTFAGRQKDEEPSENLI